MSRITAGRAPSRLQEGGALLKEATFRGRAVGVVGLTP